MDSLGDVLKNKHVPVEPEEVRMVKAYVQRKFRTKVGIVVSERTLSIIAPHAALAGTLRLELNQIISECRITKKVYIRIGS